MDEGEALLAAVLRGEGGGLLDRLALQDHLGAVPAGVDDLHRRRVDRHDDGGRDAEPVGVVGDALGVVAGRHGDHAVLALRRGQRGQAIERAALLERGRELQVLELEPDLAAEDVRQRAAEVAVGLDDGPAQARARGLDVVGSDRQRLGRPCGSDRFSGGHAVFSCRRANLGDATAAVVAIYLAGF